MWAMMPMLRTRSSGWVRFMLGAFGGGISTCRRPGGARSSGGAPGAHPLWCGTGVGPLPAVVGEGPVGLGHLVHVLAALHRSADAVAGVEELVGEALGHRLLAALPGVADQPAHGEGVGARGADLD